jgi:hypothetical protein
VLLFSKREHNTSLSHRPVIQWPMITRSTPNRHRKYGLRETPLAYGFLSAMLNNLNRSSCLAGLLLSGFNGNAGGLFNI